MERSISWCNWGISSGLALRMRKDILEVSMQPSFGPSLEAYLEYTELSRFARISRRTPGPYKVEGDNDFPSFGENNSLPT